MPTLVPSAIAATACILTLAHASAAIAALGTESGQRDFHLSCSGCHGVDGRGPGSKELPLAVQPPDLTNLRNRNGNIFPRERIRRIIDGREVIKEHGTRDMPVWGQVFKRDAAEGLGGAEGDEATVQKRIDRLINYIETLQR